MRKQLQAAPEELTAVAKEFTAVRDQFTVVAKQLTPGQRYPIPVRANAFGVALEFRAVTPRL